MNKKELTNKVFAFFEKLIETTELVKLYINNVIYYSIFMSQ
ncbi:hypothetical protein SPIRO4BDMA_70032 [uncultured spirochete]|jgi:hypothetical protein|uniref:Uncharacterized protein n=1 Tax=uncultured spirochete TaxID=156406 RepID=A0A3P3XTK1_9SPIR|nr:hypothetical protein SPIRO4BDMA_70032 [uncultured spirochete]